MKTVCITITALVTDPQALWDSAVAHGMCEGLFKNTEDAAELLGPREKPDIAECLRSIVEPQTSPTGAEIQETIATVESD